MANTSYTYSVASDTLNGQVDSDRLTIEIRDAPIVIALDYVDVTGDVLKIWFKAALDAAQQVVLTSVVNAHTGEPLPNPVNADGIPFAALYGKENAVQIVGRDDATDYIRATHNWCDSCTWFQESLRTTQTLDDSGDQLTFTSSHTRWIDMTHGRQHREDDWVAEQKAANPGEPHGYAVRVSIAGVEKTQRAPFMGSGGDYSVDYENGSITLFAPSATRPDVDFSYASASGFSIQPEAGKVIEIQEASAHMSNDFAWMDTIVMAMEVPHPVNVGEWIDVGRNTYKTLVQFIDESTFMAPVFPAQGGMRGMSYDIQALPIPYASVRKLLSSQGVRMRVYLKNDIEWTGSRVTATFKSVSYDEV